MILLLLLWTPLLHAQTNAKKAQAALSQREDPDAILARVHQRLLKMEKYISPKPLIFVGEISWLGPHCQGLCICKGALSEKVDFTIDRLVLGEHPDTLVHASYVNCSSSELPSPPFTLHEKLIVYCEQGTHFTRCWDPVAFTDKRLKRVESWIAALPQQGVQ